MNLLSHVSQGPLAYTLGWTLLHFCWQGAAVATLLWSTLALLPRRSARLRYAVSLAALGLMVALPLATFAHLAEQELSVRKNFVLPDFEIDAVALSTGAELPSLPLRDRIQFALERTAPLVPAVWLAGMVVFLARLAAGMAVARRMKSASLLAVPADLQEMFTRLHNRLGLTRAVRLLHSAKVDAPTVIGWLKPVVLIPVGCLTGMSAVQIEAVLAHELAHIRRHDYLVSVVQSVIEAVLFYHPAVWWVSRQVRQERENCCDDVAVEIAGDGLAFARALSWMEEYRAGMPEIALGANGGVLKMRIRRLLGCTESAAVSRAVAATLLAAAVAFGGVYLVTTARAQSGSAAAKPAQAEPLPAAGSGTGASQQVSEAPAGDNAKRRVGRSGAVQAGAKGESDPGLNDLPVETQALARQALAYATTFGPEDAKRLQQALFAAGKLYSPEFREKVNQAMGPQYKKVFDDYGRAWRANSPEALKEMDAKLNSPEFKKQLADAMTAAASTGSPEFRKQLDGAMKSIDALNTPEYRKKVQSLIARLGEAGGLGNSTMPGAAGQPGTGSAERAGVYRKWLDEDVVWIIQPQERDAFLKLGNDEERDAFIKTFWLRRDAPGAPANSFKDEHYRRIAYANEHFGANGVAGWRTDRGRVYILYGKPVSVDSHPAGGATHANVSGTMTSPFPFEVWHYGYVAGIGDNITLMFVDTCGCGLFNYTVDRPGAEMGKAQGMPPSVAPALSDQAMAQLIGHTIRQVDYRGLRSITLTEVAQRFARDGVRVDPETAYDPAVAARAAALLKQMIAERGRTSAVRVITNRITPDSVGILFDIKEGQSVTASHAASTGETSRAALKLVSQETPSADTPARPDGPVRVSSGTMAGSLLTHTNPIYPAEARAQHLQGSVVLHGLISKEGTVERLEVISGPELLRESAVDAVQRWTYKPYLLNGQPTEVATTITVNYTFGAPPPPPTPPPSEREASASAIPVSPGVLAGSLIYKVDPIYPPIAKAAHVQGEVVLKALISKNGGVDKLTVVSGPQMLRASAMDAVTQWTYKPYLLNGQPTEVETNITVNFSLPADTGRPDKELYDNGVAAEVQGHYDVARLRWQTLINMYPDSPLRPDTMRAISDSWQKEGAAAQARGNAFDAKKARAEYEQAVLLQNAEEPRARQDGQAVPKRIGGAVSAPTVVHTVEPEYTAEGRKAKLSGTVLLNLWVDDQGIPQHVRVVRGIADDPAAKADPKHSAIDRKAAAGLDQKAVEAVKQYRFTPSMENGMPVTVSLNIEVNFQIF